MGWKGTVRSVGAAVRAAERDSKRRQRELEKQQKYFDIFMTFLDIHWLNLKHITFGFIILFLQEYSYILHLLHIDTVLYLSHPLISIY